MALLECDMIPISSLYSVTQSVNFLGALHMNNDLVSQSDAPLTSEHWISTDSG